MNSYFNDSFLAPIEAEKRKLFSHPIYKKLNSLENIQRFMSIHIFAVWDFMTLLKAMQHRFTSVNIPWYPSSYGAEIVRFVNEIVLGEECDVTRNKDEHLDHFSLYYRAMKEVGSDTKWIDKYLKDQQKLDAPLEDFIQFHRKIALDGSDVEVAASFLYGREDIIPEMFSSFIKESHLSKEKIPDFLYYLERHIELDKDDHSVKATMLIQKIITSPEAARQAQKAAIESIQKRYELWDYALTQLNCASKA